MYGDHSSPESFCFYFFVLFFFFKQKTAYEMRISDWSSDVCSSDLDHIHFYMRPVVARDLANEQLDVNQFYACLAATPKHVMANAYLPEKVAEQRALAEMLAGGADSLDRRPLISYTACWTVSPLRYATETVEILDRIGAQRLPAVIFSAPQIGRGHG